MHTWTADHTFFLSDMYSGTTLTNKSGAVLGAHQKIDRVAYKHLRLLVEDAPFPGVRDILHFEGKNGPDGIKRKSPAKDEPWHFYDPFDDTDTQLLDDIQQHYDELTRQLKKGNPERAAFDAAWLAHAVVDGLTPAHHYPYEEKMLEIRGGGTLKERNTVKSKIIVPGDTVAQTLQRNWDVYGIKGLLSMHGFFEFGVAALLAPIKMNASRIRASDIDTLIEVGYLEVFKRAAREIALLDMYERFNEHGWTIRLSRDIRNHLGPIMARTVTLVWYSAMRDAGLLRGKK